jgi:hypothetical protein
MQRKLLAEISEVKERLIRIETLDFESKVTELERKIDKERDERVNLQMAHERLHTKLGPVFVGLASVGSSAITLVLANIAKVF